MSKHKTRNTFFFNNLGSEHSLLIKLGQLMSYDKRKKFIKNCDIKNSSRAFRVFCVSKELGTISIGK